MKGYKNCELYKDLQTIWWEKSVGGKREPFLKQWKGESGYIDPKKKINDRKKPGQREVTISRIKEKHDWGKGKRFSSAKADSGLSQGKENGKLQKGGLRVPDERPLLQDQESNRGKPSRRIFQWVRGQEKKVDDLEGKSIFR